MHNIHKIVSSWPDSSMIFENLSQNSIALNFLMLSVFNLSWSVGLVQVHIIGVIPLNARLISSQVSFTLCPTFHGLNFVYVRLILYQSQKLYISAMCFRLILCDLLVIRWGNWGWMCVIRQDIFSHTWVSSQQTFSYHFYGCPSAFLSSVFLLGVFCYSTPVALFNLGWSKQVEKWVQGWGERFHEFFIFFSVGVWRGWMSEWGRWGEDGSWFSSKAEFEIKVLCWIPISILVYLLSIWPDHFRVNRTYLAFYVCEFLFIH